MSLVCSFCGEDIDKKDQDNMSTEIGVPMCEDCFGK